MHTSTRTFVAALALVGLAAGTAAATPPTSPTAATLDVTPLGAHTSPSGDGGAEIAAHDPRTQQVVVTNGTDNTLDVLSVADPTAPTLVDSIDLSPYGAGVNSVAVHHKVIAVAVEAEVAQDPGSIVLLTNDGSLIDVVEAGALPDMVAISANGRYVVAANEGEPSDDYSVDPHGSVTVITMAGWKRITDVRHATFDHLDADELRADGVRVFGPDATAARDLEPEYVTIDGTTAHVTLQENNALATVDLRSATVTDVVALGTKDHSLPGNELDTSNEDGVAVLASRPLQGLYMPDAIASHDGYLFTANEGDAREYDAFEEEADVKDLVLDPTAFPDAAELQDDAVMGDLKVTTTLGDTDGDGDFDELYSFGARSMAVWTASGELVWDSGSLLTELTAAAGTWDDGRADNKGSEPEGVEIGVVDGVPYAFLGLERTSDIVVFDITDPTAPAFVTMVPAPHGAVSPEGLAFIAADEAPEGKPLLVATYEVTGTTVVFALA